QSPRQIAVGERQLVIIRPAKEAHLRAAQKRYPRLRPGPGWIANGCDGRFRTARRKVYQQIADLPFRDRLQMLAQRINRPTSLILRWINRWSRFPHKIN